MRKQVIRNVFLVAVALVLLPCSVVWAPPLITDTPLLLPPGGIYDSGPMNHPIPPLGGAVTRTELEMTGGSFFDVFAQPPTGGWAVDSFFDITYRIDFTGGDGSVTPLIGPGLILVDFHGLDGPPNSRQVDTEMLSMDLQGLPGGIMIRESPTLPSKGKTELLRESPTLFHIDSFFDVFTEISFDGGQQWLPSPSSTHLQLRQVPGPAIPLPAAVWGGMALMGMLGVRKFIRRR